MRTSYESLLVIATFLLFCASPSRGAFSWYDCGNALGREIYYHSVDIYPESIVAGDQFAFNFALELDKGHIWEGNYLQIDYNGETVYNLTTTNGCDLTKSIQCPYSPSSISYTDVFQAPLVPAGTYTVRITNVFGVNNFETVVGCVQITVDVLNNSSAPTTNTKKCTYTSDASITLDGFPVYFQHPDPSNITIGDWIRVGPSSAWDPSSGDSSESWGTFASIFTSKDLLFNGNVSNPSDYIWGLSATVLNNTENQLTYNGAFFVGYVGDDYPQFTDVSTPLLNGSVILTIEYDSDPSNIQITNAKATITIPYPLGFQQENWPYILGFGRLNPLLLTYDGKTNPVINGTSSINNTCTTSTNVKNTTADLIVSGGSNQSSGLTVAQKWAIGLGVGSAFLLIVIALLFFIAWKQGKRPVRRTDEDLIDPLKPDYGSQAINDIMDGSDDLPRV